MCVNFAGIYMYILWNILTFCALAACPTFSQRFFDVFFLRQNTHAQETLTWKVQCLSFQACFGCSPLVVVTWFWMFFFYHVLKRVFQPQKLEILERSLPKKSTTQQVWQPADFFRVDSQDLHFYHFWPSDPFCCGDFITLHVLGTKSQKVRGVRDLHKKHDFGVIWGWYPCWVAGPDIFHFWISSCNLMSSGLGKEWGLISQCLSGFSAFFLPKPNGLQKERLGGNPPQNSRLPTKSENIPPGFQICGAHPPKWKKSLHWLQVFLFGGEQTIKPKHEVSGSQHDNTMFFLGTEAPMVAALGRCGSLRDPCAAIHLSNKKRSWESHLITQNNKDGLLEACSFLHFSDMANMATTSCSPKPHEAQKRGAPPKVLNRQRKIIATVQFWKNISTNISCWCLSKIPSIACDASISWAFDSNTVCL